MIFAPRTNCGPLLFSKASSDVEDKNSEVVSRVIERLLESNRAATQDKTCYWTEFLNEEQRKFITEGQRKKVIYSDGEETDIEVPLQIKHETTNPVISSSSASQSCESLGIKGLLKELNEVLRTSYNEDHPGLLPHLEKCIDSRYDFGTAFGRLRPYWFDDFTQLQNILDARALEDKQQRERALDKEHNLITEPHIEPRRVWDLYSNRVLPISVTPVASPHGRPANARLWAISHSWVAKELRHSVGTPINGYEWRASIPKDTTLDRVRIELLNLGAEYAWLDVLCLRQEDRLVDEVVREEEWKLDVPTIGSVYRRRARIVTYFEGLGRPFRFGDVSSQTHWLNRAWTLQEASSRTLLGGLTSSSPLSPFLSGEQEYSANQLKKLLTYGDGDDASGSFSDLQLDNRSKQFYADLGANWRQFAADFTQSVSGASVCTDSEDIFPNLRVMLNRQASHEVDKIVGLAYILKCRRLPAYSRGKDDEDAHEKAWSHLIEIMRQMYQIQLAFDYPVPGDGIWTWRPTWRQLKSGLVTPLPYTRMRFREIVQGARVAEDGSYKLMAHLLSRCTIHTRQRDLVIEVLDQGIVAFSYTTEACHIHTIRDGGDYVLVAPKIERAFGHPMYWMVGTYASTRLKAIRKVSVLEHWMDHEIWNELGKRKLVTECEVTLV
ncbi:hypothetical protein NM688_g978 [Phlebia brevispora]|uniref:Uncharacterized protein n=1 Tax=Phlebia brevispora TaxID=194682 RepID=A0ACC1TCL0_9APHY|nr:hypothetical protein NM688_g978 [Phlebia brevispora]